MLLIGNCLLDLKINNRKKNERGTCKWLSKIPELFAAIQNMAKTGLPKQLKCSAAGKEGEIRKQKVGHDRNFGYPTHNSAKKKGTVRCRKECVVPSSPLNCISRPSKPGPDWREFACDSCDLHLAYCLMRWESREQNREKRPAGVVFAPGFDLRRVALTPP